MKTTATSTSRAATMTSSVAAALLLFVLGSTSVISTVATDATRMERLPPPYNLAPPGGGTTGLRSGSSSFEFGKVDVFIDLACPKSAEAWPSLKQVVEDQRHRAQFVFHVLPLSDDPIDFFAAKAVQVILANSGGTYDDVKYFIDWVFRGRDVVFFDGDPEMTLDARELITDWAVSSSSLSFTTFHSAMQDPAFDELVLEDLEDRFVLSVESTPTVLLNGIFMMHIDGSREMLDFEFFLESSGFPAFDDEPSSRSISSSGSSGSRSEMWEQIGKELRVSYEDMVQWQEEKKMHKQQQQDNEQRPYDSHSADKNEWQENASSSGDPAAFSPASTSLSSSSSSTTTVATSPSWGSFSFYSSGTADSSSAWSIFEESSPSASSQSSATATSPSSASPLSWGWPRWPSFVTSLFKGRRDDQSGGGGWGWGAQFDDAPAVSAAALAAKAEAAVAAAAAQVVDTAAAKDPKITTRRGGHYDGVRGRGGFLAAAPAEERAISGSELEKDAAAWWAYLTGDESAGAAAAAEISDGPAAGKEDKARGGEEELGARPGEGHPDFKTGVVAADAVAAKQ